MSPQIPSLERQGCDPGWASLICSGEASPPAGGHAVPHGRQPRARSPCTAGLSWFPPLPTRPGFFCAFLRKGRLLFYPNVLSPIALLSPSPRVAPGNQEAILHLSCKAVEVNGMTGVGATCGTVMEVRLVRSIVVTSLLEEKSLG